MRPVSVTERPPDIGALALRECETVGASNEKRALLVPMLLPTISWCTVLDRKLILPRHDTVDAEDHDVVLHELSEPSMTAVCVTLYLPHRMFGCLCTCACACVHSGAYPPKLRPEIVTDKTPDIAVFEFSAFDRDGASKVKAFTLVPTAAPTVITADLVTLGAEALRTSPPPHKTRVFEVHDVVVQVSGSSATPTVGVTAPIPNSMPHSVIAAIDVAGMLRLGKWVTTGELYENPLTRVPTTAETVTTGDSFEKDPCGEMQVRVDRVTQDTVSHLVSSTDADGDVLVLMKFMPVMLTVSPPVLGELLEVTDITGASKVNWTRFAVPTTALMVTARFFLDPYPPGVTFKHLMAVEEAQAELMHGVPPMLANGDESYNAKFNLYVDMCV